MVAHIGIEPTSSQREPSLKLGIPYLVLRLDFLLY